MDASHSALIALCVNKFAVMVTTTCTSHYVRGAAERISSLAWSAYFAKLS